MSTIDCINLSNISLIGYTYMDERFKDELISNIPHKKIEINSSSFSIKSLLRDMKIDSLLSDKIENYTHLLLDINDVVVIGKESYDRYYGTRKVIEEIRDTEYKLLITSPLNRDVGSVNTNVFKGGNQLLYICDVAFKVSDGKIESIKNRYEKY